VRHECDAPFATGTTVAPASYGNVYSSASVTSCVPPTWENPDAPVSTNVTPATGSRFVYTTGANLWVVDAAQPSAPVELAALAVSGAFVLAPGGTGVVYAGTGAGGAGLYGLVLP
jgi:hypothetical protein